MYYNNMGRRLVAETLFFNGSGRATRGMAMWSVANVRGEHAWQLQLQEH